MRMYANNWSLIFIHLILILQLVLAVIFFKKHPKVSICVVINLVLILIFNVSPFTISYGNAFGRFLFQVLHIVNTGVLTLAIFGWRSDEKKGLDPIGISEILSGPAALAKIGPELIWGFTGAWIAAIVLSLCAIIAVVSENLDLILGFSGLLLLTEAVSSVFGAIILYRAWQTVQDGRARTTPGKAVGFLFIPIYNFYWIFVGFAGLAKELNAFRQRHNLRGETLPEQLFVAQCILALLGIIITQIPVIGYLYGIAISVLGLNLFWRIFRVVNEIAGGMGKEQAVELYPESSTETS